ncbi:MAG: VanW family protein [Parcubacteria group bacterium]|nr:VanW family protein [Parcubacteria group bacterium]
MEWSASLHQHKKVLLISAGVAVGIFVVGLAAAVVASEAYFADRIYPHVAYADIQLGGLTRPEASVILENWQEQWWRQELKYTAYDETGQTLTTAAFYPVLVVDSSSQSHELVWYDMDKMLDQAFRVGRGEAGQPASRFSRSARLVRQVFSQTSLRPIIEIDEVQLQNVLQLKLADYETQPRDAQLAWRSAYMPPTVVSEEPGNTFDYVQAVAATEAMLYEMRNRTVPVKRIHRVPLVPTAEVRSALDALPALQARFPAVLTYHDERSDTDRRYELPFSTAYLAVQPVRPDPTQPVRLHLVEEGLRAFFAAIEKEVNLQPQNAKFEVDADVKVKLFEPSRTGYALDRQATLAAINVALDDAVGGVATTALAVQTLSPDVTTERVNDLGIKEILGTGYSNFRGSPKNRIHNISVGVRQLNGTLIAPDEEFSLLNALKPFTSEAGYLPELVIKGDKIEPEIGGGLCQIGSTTFRAAMNSGLLITERRNHSLVVSYYNDPRNHNPGTDATIYDPSPDFKFKNDTGHYILIATDMNAATGDLTFSFWGTNDGRKGEYSEPKVSRWIPAGEEKLVESTDLEPGVKKCQEGHIGAVASFVYIVTKEGMEPVETTYTSTYRPLPRICLIGVAEAAPGTSPSADGLGPVQTEPDGQEVVF